LIGLYWVGCLLVEGKGCAQNVELAIEYLEKASTLGNCQADHQLFTIYSSEDFGKKDILKAYTYLLNAMENGVTAFTDIGKFFKDNLEVLKPAFLERKKITTIDKDEEVLNLHDAYVNENLSKFEEAMKKDMLYENATAFMNNGMIWLMKVLKMYFADSVLRFNHADFLIAVKEDLPPLFSNVGIWIMENWLARTKELGGNKDLEKRIKTCLDITKKINDKGIEYFEKESRYHLLNKYSPKKCPEEAVARSSIEKLYSFKIYARPEYFQHIVQKKKEAELAAKRAKATKCANCGCPEGKQKYKMCSACKKVHYCSPTCQKTDWKAKHKAECKAFRAAAKK